MAERRTPNPGVGGSNPSWPAQFSGDQVIRQLIKKIEDFFQDSLRELKKVIFPSLDEVIGSTKVVIITVLIISAFLGLIDFILSKLVGYILS